MKKLKSLFISSDKTLKEALHQLDQTGCGLLLLIDQHGILRRTITDGDCRRLLLHDVQLQDTLEFLPAKEPIVLRGDYDRLAARLLMEEHGLTHIPIVDESGVPVDLIRLQDCTRVWLSPPHMGSQEQQFVAEAFESNWIAPLGPQVDAFENEMKQLLNVKAAAAVNSGTSAIHLALRVLGVSSGDTVFVSSFTFVASVTPILFQQAIPVFIDSEPGSWNMSPQALERAFEDALAKGQCPKAVIVVNIYGQSADYDRLLPICERYQVPIIEDAAESLGATYRGRASGTIGVMGIYSFNGNKIITTSGGGLLVSQNENYVEKARFLSTQAKDPAPHYLHSELGYNYRMSNVLAGIGRGQLRVLADRVQARRAVFERYQQGLADLPGLQWMPEIEGSFSTRWLSTLTLDDRLELTPQQLMQELAQHDIEARAVWYPMHRQPLLKSYAYYSHDPENSVCDHLFKQGLCLPSGSNLSMESQERIIQRLRTLLTRVVA